MLMKHTVHIINAMQIGGVEVGVLSLLKSNINQSYNVITVKGCDEDLYKSLSSDEQSRLHICNGYFNVFLLLIKLKPKIIISSLWRAHLASLIFKIIKPNIKRVHFVHSAGFTHFVDNIINRISVLMANFVFCDSKQSQEWLKRVIGVESSVVVPMNVSFSNEKKAIAFAPINFVFVGRFSKEKNLFKAIEFIKLLNDYGLLATLDLYGRDEGELEDLLSYVNIKGLSHCVNFHDSILPPKVESEMKKYNYYLQTSLFEGMSISVYQSIKNGLLPVITPVGEIQNYTVNGLNAFYIDISDLNVSAKSFKETISCGKIQNYKVGHMVNKQDYPEFDASFFSEVENLLIR